MPSGAFNDALASDFTVTPASHGSDVLSGSALTASHLARHMGQPLALSTSSGTCRVHSRSAGSLRRTCFADIQPGGPGDGYPSDAYQTEKDGWYVEPGPDWLGIVEDSENLASTTLLSKDWVIEGDRIDKTHLPWKCPDVHPLENPPYKVWWHPEFVFKRPWHAVRIRLKRLDPGKDPDKDRMMWDVIFAGKPGNPWTIPPDAPPAGGNLPVFEMFCPPLPEDIRLELRLTEAENEWFDETLTLVPTGKLNKWQRKLADKPRINMYTKEETEGPLPFDPEQTSLGEGMRDELGQVNYMAMPISPFLMTLASFL